MLKLSLVSKITRDIESMFPGSVGTRPARLEIAENRIRANDQDSAEAFPRHVWRQIRSLCV